jgi:small-conductance mechanosensitive channel
MHLHIDPATGIWLVVASIGAGLSFWLRRYFVRLQHAATAIARPGLIRDLAIESTKYNTASETLRLFTHMLCVFIGAYAGLGFPQAALVAVTGLLSINLLLMVNSYLTYRTWMRREAIYQLSVRTLVPGGKKRGN